MSRRGTMRRVRREPELLVCGLRGHRVPGADIATIDARHAAIARPTADGRRLVRCLRCGDWILVAAPAQGSPLDDVDTLERPARGRALRQELIVRVIAVDRAVHTVAFAAVGVAAIALDRDIGGVHSWANDLLNDLNSSKQGSGGASSHGF